MHPRRGVLSTGIVLLLAASARAQRAAPAAADPPPVFADRGLAIRGYDPVAYFMADRPVRGNAQFTHRWAGATWRFSTAANRDAFAADPQRYAPQYGGFCAFAVAQGYTAPIDPQAWRIVDGRLYLNYDRATQRRWEANMADFIAGADRNWPGIAARLPAN